MTLVETKAGVIILEIHVSILELQILLIYLALYFLTPIWLLGFSCIL